MASNHRSLLIVSCSQRKRSNPGLLPAIDRYDGPTFRVLRRFLKEMHSAPVDIFILSAKFGLILHDQPIPNYDQRMTQLRAQELHPSVMSELRHIFSSQSYQRFCICIGKDYLLALDGYDILTSSAMSINVASGSHGKILAELHNWLYGKSSPLTQKPQPTVSNGRASLQGIEMSMTPSQVLDKARRALKEGKGDPTNYYSWYVQVDGQRVASKWLVSHVFDLPVKAFTTDEARRVLVQLGIEVRRK